MKVLAIAALLAASVAPALAANMNDGPIYPTEHSYSLAHPAKPAPVKHAAVLKHKVLRG